MFLYCSFKAELNDTEVTRLDGIIAENQTAINNLMKVLMLGKVTDVILAQIEQLENANKNWKQPLKENRAIILWSRKSKYYTTLKADNKASCC